MSLNWGMRTGNPKSAIVSLAIGIGFILSVLAVLPHLPETVLAFIQNLQNPSPDGLVTAVTYIVVAFVAFAIPTSVLGVFVAVIGNADT